MKKVLPLSSMKMSRRNFGKLSAAGVASSAFSFSILPSHARGNLTKPTVVGIGTGGKGKTDITRSHEAGFQIAGLVDTADATKMSSKELENKRLKGVIDIRNQYKDVPFFTDYREMFAEMGDQVDAVTVSTPDHHHRRQQHGALQRHRLRPLR